MWQTSSSGVIGSFPIDLDNDDDHVHFEIVISCLFKLTTLVNSNHLRLEQKALALCFARLPCPQ